MGAFSQGPMNPATFAATQVMPQRIQEFFVDVQRPRKYSIAGVTKDATGAPLGGCTVEVYETVTAANPNEPKGRFVGSTVSDTNGNYSVDVYVGPGATFRAVVSKAGAPDVAGTSVNTLVGV
jgi:hypothetical protein